MPLTFYAAAEQESGLQSAQRYLQSQPLPVELYRTRRRDLFQPEPLEVLAVRSRACDQQEIFRQLARRLPDLAYYDSDLPFGLHHAARFDTFPLARCRIEADADGNVRAIQALDTPWDIDPQPAPLRVLQLEPDCDPGHAPPRALLASYERYSYKLRLDQPRPLLINLRALLTRHDPDLLLTAWGDTWLLPLLLDLSCTYGLPLPLNRDERMEVGYREERSYSPTGRWSFAAAGAPVRALAHRSSQRHAVG